MKPQCRIRRPNRARHANAEMPRHGKRSQKPPFPPWSSSLGMGICIDTACCYDVQCPAWGVEMRGPWSTLVAQRIAMLMEHDT
jgi:hypothetical protein